MRKGVDDKGQIQKEKYIIFLLRRAGSLEEVTVAAGRASENASQRSITGVRDHTFPYEHDLLSARDVVDVVAEGNEQIKEELKHGASSVATTSS